MARIQRSDRTGFFPRELGEQHRGNRLLMTLHRCQEVYTCVNEQNSWDTRAEFACLMVAPRETHLMC